MKQRSTRQLVATFEALAASCDHPTAEQVCERVRRSVPQISLGTVYRNLDKLVRQGRARIVRLDGVQRYDAMTAPHDHFICQRCTRVSDVAPAKSPPDTRSLRRAGYRVSSHSVAYYGVCPACAAPKAGTLRRVRTRAA